MRKFRSSGMDDDCHSRGEDILAHDRQDVLLIFAGRGAPDWTKNIIIA